MASLELTWGFFTDTVEIIQPTEAEDLMSYAGSRWISDYNWREIRECMLEVFLECGDDRPEGKIQTVGTGVTSDTLLITGLISGGVEILESLHLSESVVPTSTIEKARAAGSSYSTAAGDHELELYDSGGSLLYSQPYTYTYLNDGLEPFFMFNIIAPYVEGTAEVRVISATHTASRTVSANAPSVTLLSPNGGEVVDETLTMSWEGNDIDGDDLYYSVQYSADGG